MKDEKSKVKEEKPQKMMRVENIGVQPIYIGGVLLYGGRVTDVPEKMVEIFKSSEAGEYYFKNHLKVSAKAAKGAKDKK